MIWLLGTLAASAAVMYAVFNTSQIAVGKERAVNAADAATLAGATAEARLLNLMAYANRGVVANEVFLAQMLSMESWLQYIGHTSSNIKTFLNVVSLIPPVTAIAQAAAKAMQFVQKLADEGHAALQGKIVPAVIKGLEIAKSGLVGAEDLLNTSGGGLVAGDAAKQIVSANKTTFNGRWDPGISIANTGLIDELTFVKNNKDWIAFTRQYSKNERSDAKYILEQSVDRFTASRPGIWWTNMSVFFTGMEKHGGSTLQGFDRWESEDTLERWDRVWCKVKWCKNYQAIGWGRANADQDGNTGSTWEPRRSAQSKAQSQGSTHGGWSGVPALYDIADKSPAKRADLGLDFVVAVARKGSSDFTTTTIPMGKGLPGSPLGSPETPLRQEAAQNTAIGKARVFFERPRRGLAGDSTASGLWRPDGAKEYGSLYSPYWQARLRDLTKTEKGLLLAEMGLTPDYVYYTPGGQL